MSIRIGTRASNLAMWQATAVLNTLTSAGLAAEIVPLTSQGDRSLGGQLSASVGQFIHSIDDRLLSGEIDIAVHSSKDVPVDVDRRIRSLAYLDRLIRADRGRRSGEVINTDSNLPPVVDVDSAFDANLIRVP